MAKTIKFNLICDGKPIRTIEDLQNNFVIEDMLAYYDDKLLQRWLKVRGYTEELEKVEAITVTQPVEIIKELIQIFQIESDEKKVEENTYIFNYLEERRELCNLYEQQNYKVRNIVEDYEIGYRQLVEDILDHPNNAAKIKADIKEMANNYAWVFSLNHRELFFELLNVSYLAVMCLLMNSKTRDYYLPVEIINEDNFVMKDIDTNADKRFMYSEICKIISTSKFREELGDNLISFAGVTDSYWKDLELKGKKYMIIDIGQGDRVRSAGKKDEDLEQADIKHNFLIVDGIDYKSNSSTRQLLYMEV